MSKDIIKLIAADGSEQEFYSIAGIRYKGDFYAILRPVQPMQSLGDDEALVFKVTPDKAGDPSYSIVLEDKIVDGVFKKYNKLVDQSEGLERPMGDPKNMLVDVGVFFVLGIISSVTIEFLNIMSILGLFANTVYFVMHLGAFLLGKRRR